MSSLFPDQGDRRRYRHARETGRGRGFEWANEGFTFNSLEEYAVFKKVRPDLFDPQASPRDRAKRWKAFANTSEGRALRVR